jgi:pimeloyl-ACP methyl ester carboxylesterase
MSPLWRLSGRTRARTLVRILLAAIVFAVVGLAFAGSLYEYLAEYHDRQAFPQHGRFVDVGGYRLNLDCSGAGSPTVILDSGVGEPGREWALVQPRIAESTRVCSYDRGGYGWSDAGPRPRTSARIVEELHTALVNAGEQPPYILAGHSFGGLTVRLYASRYAGEVTGVVLVDASHPDQEAKGFKPVVSPLSFLEPVLLRVGLLRALFVLDGAPKLPRSLYEELEYLMLQPKAIAADLDEVRGFSESAAQVRAAGNLGNKPLVVLTAAYSAQRRPHLHQVWIHELQPDLVRLSTRGKQIIVNTGHYIPLQRPEAVVTAVREVFEMVRQSAGPVRSSAASDANKSHSRGITAEN